MKQQKGFNVVGLIVIIAVVGIVGFVGYYVWQKTRPVEVKESVATTATTAAQPETVKETKQTVPDGYVLYESTSPKFSFVYPKEWDLHKDKSASKGVKVDVLKLDAEVPYILTRTIVHKYDSTNGQWYVLNKEDGSKDYSPSTVLWKDSQKTVYNFGDGDAGCGMNAPTFVTKENIIKINTPAICVSIDGGPSTNEEFYSDNNAKLTIPSKTSLQTLSESISF